MNSVRSVFIVDDAADYRFLLQQIFAHYLPTYPVRFFTDGKGFLEELRGGTQLPSLVILDRHMPQRDGYQTLMYLKRHPAYQTIPVVMMSAQSTQSEIHGCYEAGTNSFLLKPVDFDELKKTIIKVCEYWLTLNEEPGSA